MLICPTIIHSLNKSCINASIIFNYAFPHVSLKSTRLRFFSLSLDPWVSFIFYFLQSRKLVSEFSNWPNQMSPQVELVCFGQEYTTFPVAHQRPATQMGKQRQSVHLNSSIWAKHTMLEVLSRSGSICVEGMDRWRLDRNPSIWCSILTWNVICPQPSDLTHWLPPAVCVLLELPASSVSCASTQLRLILKWIFKDFHLPQLSYQELNFILE